MGYFGSPGKVKKNVLGFTHVDEQLCFSMFPSILIFDLTKFFVHFGLYGALMGYSSGRCRVQKQFLGLLM